MICAKYQEADLCGSRENVTVIFVTLTQEDG